MATTPEDADALFDLSTPAAPPAATAGPSAPPASNSVPPAGAPAPAGLPTIGSESRREQRVKVSWPARAQLPDGRVIELRVRDVSDSGVGLFTPVHLPTGTPLNFAMGVPGLNDPSKITPVTGTLRASYCVVQGNDIHCGGTWVQLPADGRELIGKWIRKIRR
jgi:hypothetical protein